ncbi:MAG: GNAT family N-acetyltransferase [Thermomicrobiales bacterium]
MANIRIRAVEPTDAEALNEIFNCPGVIAGTLQLPFRSLEFSRERLAQRSPDAHYLVAEIGGRVVGNLGLSVEANPRRRHAGSIGMGVHDDVQNQGVGSALVAAALDLADNWLGLRRVELTVFIDNAPAIRLYEKFGFTIEGAARQFALRNGEYVDAYMMARLKP